MRVGEEESEWAGKGEGVDMQGGKWVCPEEAFAQAQSCPVEGLVGEQAG